MKIKHTDIEIDSQNPFKNCRLNRGSYALVLTDIVANYADGFVLAINNDWGTGKTTFIKMWQKHLETVGFETIYFNAWENDFTVEPLAAIISEFQTLTDKYDGNILKSVIQIGAILSRKIFPALIQAAAKKYTNVDIISDAIKNVSEGAFEILNEEIKEYANKKRSVLEFRTELEKFVKQIKTQTKKPLIFFIDELDRCRPNYAVELLEQIKHLFSVSGIVFVLSIDKTHLASSIKGFYGSENINTDEYLRRFIDLEYSIPEPSNNAFCSYLYNYYSFDTFFTSDLEYESEVVLQVAESLFDESKATLRQQEKIFALTRLILCSFSLNKNQYFYFIFVLIYIKIMETEFYLNIKNDVYSLQELLDMFENIIPFDRMSLQPITWIAIEALLLYFYNNNRSREGKEEFFDNKQECLVRSKLGQKLRCDGDLAYQLTFVQQYQSNFGRNLNYFLNKIDLLEPMIQLKTNNKNN